MYTNIYYIQLQFLIFNINTNIPIFFLEIDEIIIWLEINFTNNFTSWQYFDDCDNIKFKVYSAFAKLKSIARKLEVIIFFRNLI